MFGFGKKEQPKDTEGAPLPAAAGVKEEAPVIPDERIITMPEEYRSVGAPLGGHEKRLWMVIGGALVFLVLLAGGLYVFLFSDQSKLAEDMPEQPAITTPVETEDQIPEEPQETEQDTIIRGQAYSSANQLLGELSMTVPVAVTQTHGAAMGITALGENDITIPSDIEHSGGVYSLYPNGVTFSEMISFEIIAADFVSTSSREDFYPATLRGTAWEEIAGHQATGGGWSFTLDRFPVGPITVVRRVLEDEAAEETESGVPASVDTDGDGLTDTEELLFGTSVSSADTDSDTYDDRTEIMGNYSPLAAGAPLADANLFATYTNTTYGYTVAYPRVWLADSLDTTNKQVLFISETEEFFEILIEENPLEAPIMEWYRSQSPLLAEVELAVTVVDGRGAVWSLDGLTLYVGHGGLVYILTYNRGTLEAINWPTVFEYFYKSFRFAAAGAYTLDAPETEEAL